MRERALRFGETALVGVITEPSPDRSGSGLPAVLMLNAGILHHVGACRLYVRVARRLAEAGFTSLRFDLSGVGDSEPRRDALSYEQSAPLEVQEAMDHLEAGGQGHQFILLGLCSGADLASRVARTDQRVVGLVLIDTWSYRTWQFWVRHYGLRLHRPDVWRNYLLTRLRRWLIRPAPAQPSGDLVLPGHIGALPPKEVAAAGVRALVDRGVSQYYLFTGGQPMFYNYRRQFQDSFRGIDFGGLLRVDYLEDADHILTGLLHQQFVIDSVAQWATTGWPAGAGAQPGAAAHRPE